MHGQVNEEKEKETYKRNHRGERVGRRSCGTKAKKKERSDGNERKNKTNTIIRIKNKTTKMVSIHVATSKTKK